MLTTKQRDSKRDYDLRGRPDYDRQSCSTTQASRQAFYPPLRPPDPLQPPSPPPKEGVRARKGRSGKIFRLGLFACIFVLAELLSSANLLQLGPVGVCACTLSVASNDYEGVTTNYKTDDASDKGKYPATTYTASPAGCGTVVITFDKPFVTLAGTDFVIFAENYVNSG